MFKKNLEQEIQNQKFVEDCFIEEQVEEISNIMTINNIDDVDLYEALHSSVDKRKYSNLSDEMIEKKFQLLTTQYNMVKREACKKCVEYARRQAPFNIEFYYEGDENWDCDVEFGADAEAGCIGCGWYDMKKWKDNLIKAANRENYGDGDEDDE